MNLPFMYNFVGQKKTKRLQIQVANSQVCGCLWLVGCGCSCGCLWLVEFELLLTLLINLFVYL